MTHEDKGVPTCTKLVLICVWNCSCIEIINLCRWACAKLQSNWWRDTCPSAWFSILDQTMQMFVLLNSARFDMNDPCQETGTPLTRSLSPSRQFEVRKWNYVPLQPFNVIRFSVAPLWSCQHLKVPIDTFTNCGDQHKKGNIDWCFFYESWIRADFSNYCYTIVFFDVLCCVKKLRPTWHCSDGGASAADRSERAPSRRMHPSESAMHAWFKTRTFQIYYNLYDAEEQLGTALVEPAPRIWIWIYVL